MKLGESQQPSVLQKNCTSFKLSYERLLLFKNRKRFKSHNSHEVSEEVGKEPSSKNTIHHSTKFKNCLHICKISKHPSHITLVCNH